MLAWGEFLLGENVSILRRLHRNTMNLSSELSFAKLVIIDLIFVLIWTKFHIASGYNFFYKNIALRCTLERLKNS